MYFATNLLQAFFSAEHCGMQSRQYADTCIKDICTLLLLYYRRYMYFTTTLLQAIYVLYYYFTTGLGPYP